MSLQPPRGSLMAAAGALDRHVALIGFMGAGKSTLGREVAARLQRPFLDVDERIERREGPIPELFERGVFREVEERFALEALATPPRVIALGGGAVPAPAHPGAPPARAAAVGAGGGVAPALQRRGHSDRPLPHDDAPVWGPEFRR